MSKESGRQALVDALRHRNAAMRQTLRKRKKEGERERERPDFVWHLLLQSFATWGGSRGWVGLIGTKENYDRVTFGALSRLGSEARLQELEEVFLVAGVRYAHMKAPLMSENHDLVARMGGPEEAKRLAFAQEGREAKIAFMKRFRGIGDKYARNIWMDSYDPDFRDAVAVDDRIKRVTEALGYSFGSYEEHEQFYQGVAAEAGLEPWEVDRLLYNHRDEFLAAVRADGQDRSTDLGATSARQLDGPMIRESSREVSHANEVSAHDLVALSGLPRALGILEETIDAEVKEDLARFSRNRLKRASANLAQQIREDQGYFVYASLNREANFGCYVGYELRKPGGYPRLQVGLYTDTESAGSEVTRAAIERVSCLKGWQLNPEHTEQHEVWRETNLVNLLGEGDHVAAVKRFFVESLRQLEAELTTFKEEYPELPWEMGTAKDD